MNKIAQALRNGLLLWLAAIPWTCFATDCDADKTYRHCLQRYVRDYKVQRTPLNGSDFKLEIGQIKQNIYQDQGGLGSDQKKTLLDQLDVLLGAVPSNADDWQIRDDNAKAGGVPWTILKDSACHEKKPGQDATCDQRAREAIRAAGYIEQTGSAITRANLLNKHALYAEYRNRKERWTAYLYDTQFQYFWELAINKRLEDNKVATDKYENEIGFREPPDRKLVLLHPDVGLQYAPNQPDGQKFRPALLLQWGGIQWWDWKGNKISNLRGVSIVSAYSDNATGDVMTTGIQFQYDNYDIAFTSMAGRIAVTLNLKLFDRISSLNEEYAAKLKSR